MTGPQRRSDDPTPNPDADEAERVLAELPRIVPSLHRWRTATLILALGTLVAFLIVAHRTEVTQDQMRVSAFNQCQVANDNASALNKFIDRIIVAARASTTLTATEKADRVAQYRSIKQALPVCAKP